MKSYRLDVEDYIKLLDLSASQIGYYEKLYNSRLYETSAPNNKLKLRYHLFAYSQLVYALKIRLTKELLGKCSASEELKKIEKFFKKQPIKRIGDLWKHEGLKFHQTFVFNGLIKNGVIQASKVEAGFKKEREDKRVKNDIRNLSEEVQNSIKDIKSFLRQHLRGRNGGKE